MFNNLLFDANPSTVIWYEITVSDLSSLFKERKYKLRIYRRYVPNLWVSWKEQTIHCILKNTIEEAMEYAQNYIAQLKPDFYKKGSMTDEILSGMSYASKTDT